uniref:Uncharacterized protein n=1 Tax=Anopheles albimanus TaxID=7167 RepID=A0A182FQ89_ANOAL
MEMGIQTGAYVQHSKEAFRERPDSSGTALKSLPSMLPSKPPPTTYPYDRNGQQKGSNKRYRALGLGTQLRSNVTDACERHDPCQHGGICISTDSGPICECRNLEYEGTYCEREVQSCKSSLEN